MESYAQRWIPELQRLNPLLGESGWQFIDRVMGIRSVQDRIGSIDHLEGIQYVNGLLETMSVQPHLIQCPDGRFSGSTPVVVASNHHLGAVDGLVLLSLVSRWRPDVKILANRVVYQACPQLRTLMIPVNSVTSGLSNIAAARRVSEHLDAGGALIAFPAERVARRGRTGIVADEPWSPILGRLLRIHRAGAVPVAVLGCNSRLYYALQHLHPRLGAFVLLREALKKSGQAIPVIFGPTVGYDSLGALQDGEAIMQALRAEVDRLLESSR